MSLQHWIAPFFSQMLGSSTSSIAQNSQDIATTFSESIKKEIYGASKKILGALILSAVVCYGIIMLLIEADEFLSTYQNGEMISNTVLGVVTLASIIGVYALLRSDRKKETPILNPTSSIPHPSEMLSQFAKGFIEAFVNNMNLSENYSAPVDLKLEQSSADLDKKSAIPKSASLANIPTYPWNESLHDRKDFA